MNTESIDPISPIEEDDDEDVVIETESTITASQLFHHQHSQQQQQHQQRIYNNPHQYIAGSGAILYEPDKSVQGYVLFFRNIHPEVKEDDLEDLLLMDYGRPITIRLPLDNRTGYLKGYGLVEFRDRSVAEQVKAAFNGYSFMGKRLAVDFGFISKK